MVQFASYLRRVLCKTRLIFPRINGPIVSGVGVGYLGKFCTLRSVPYHFWQKNYPFCISSIDKWYPLHMPLLTFNCRKSTVFQMWINTKTERFLHFFTACKWNCLPFCIFVQTEMTNFLTISYTSRISTLLYSWIREGEKWRKVLKKVAEEYR